MSGHKDISVRKSADHVYESTPFDLSEQWLALLVKHVFPNEDIQRFVVSEKLNDKILGQYSYRCKCLPGILKAVAVLPIVNYYSTYNYPLYSKATSESFFHQFYNELGDEFWDLLEFGSISKQSQIYSDLIQSLKAQNLRYIAYFKYTNWYLDVECRSYHDYSLSLPKRLQNTIKRKSKQLQNSQKLKIKIYLGKDIVPCIKDYQMIYDKSWKPKEGYPEFIKEMMEMFALLGWGRLGIAYFDGIPIASQFWIVKDNVAYIYKLAHIKGNEKLSSGTLLTAQLMEHVIDRDKVEKVDFLVGDEIYKRDWMSHSRELWRVVVFNKTYKGMLMAVNAIIRQKIKRIIKSYSYG